MTTNHTPSGRFSRGNCANPSGRPTNEQRVRRAIEAALLDAGATAEDVERLARAAGDPVKAALAIAVMAAAVTERAERVTPSPVSAHRPGALPAR